MKAFGGNTQKQMVLIATLGSEPQVVTAAYDLLLQQGFSPSLVKILHTTGGDPKVDRAVKDLRRELKTCLAANLETSFHPLKTPGGQYLGDVDSPEAVQVYFQALYRLVWQEKRAGRQVHLSIAGGRKTMAVYGMAVAQLLFDEADSLWHLFSGGDFLSSRRMHPLPGDVVRLVQIPVIPWSSITPVLSNLKDVDDPYRALERVNRLQLHEKYESARVFVLGQLTPAERRVAACLAQEGLSDAAIAERLFISPRTVEQHLRSAYAKAELHWQLEKVTRSQLITLLQYYFSTRIGEIPDGRRSQTG